MSKIQNIDVRFTATSNFGKVKADMAALTAAANSLNSAFRATSYATPAQIVNPEGWRNATSAVTRASNVFRDAAASSNMWRVQQIRATTEAEKFTKALEKQKLTMGEMWRNRGIMREVYNDQLRGQRMVAQYWGTDKMGRAVTDIAVPKSVPRDLDTMRNRMAMFSAMTKSASTQMINLGKNTQWAGRQLTVGFTYPLAMLGAAAGIMAFQVKEGFASIRKVYDYSAEAQANGAQREREANQLRAQSMDLARQSAEKYGATIQDTLEIEGKLAATGLKGQKLFDTTSEVQRISRLGDIDAEQTTDMIVALQTAFKDTVKTSDDLTNVLNFMNETSNATSLSLQDIAEATPRAASGMAQLGVTAEEMTIMLVSMREAGVDAAEGANALKSATTRILNPVRKAKDIYAQYGISIDEISKKSGGNLFKFLKLLGVEQQKINATWQGSKKATEDETARLRAQGIAALFGTYQFNRLNAALVNLSDAYGGVQNQTAKGLEIFNKTDAERARNAAKSLEDITENAAGRLREAWSKFTIELSEMGGPFLIAAEKIVSVITDIASAFNSAPSWVKKVVASLALVAAAAGPLIMTVGLLINLWGQAVKGFGQGIGFVSRLMGAMKILNLEERAAQKTTEAANKAIERQGVAAATTAKEIAVLTASIEKAIGAFNTMHGITNKVTGPGTQHPLGGGYAPFGPAGTQMIGGLTGPTMLNGQSGGLSQQYLGSGKNAIPISVQEAQKLREVDKRDERGRILSNENRLMMARNRLAYDYMKVNGLVARDATKTAHRLALQARLSDKMAGSMGTAGLATGAMSASMATMMLSSNKTVDNIAKWGMILAIGGPVLAGMANGMVKMASAAKAAAVAMMVQNAAAGGGVKSLVRGAGALGTMRAGAAALGTKLVGTFGPGGLIATGVIAIGAGFYLWNKHMDKMRAKQLAAEKSVNNLMDDWAKGAGKVRREYASVARSQKEAIELTNRQKLVDSFLSGDREKDLKAYSDLSEGSKTQQLYAQQYYLQLITQYKYSATEAQGILAAMFIASGDAAMDADRKVNQLRASYSALSNAANVNGFDGDFAFFKNQRDIWMNRTGEEENYRQMGKDAADAWKRAFLAADPGSAAANNLIKELQHMINSDFQRVFEATSADSEVADFFTKLGITGGESLRKAIASAGGWNKFISLDSVGDAFRTSNMGQAKLDQIGDALKGVRENEKLLVSEIQSGSDQMGTALGDTVDSVYELMNSWFVMTQTMTMSQQIAEVKKFQAILALTQNSAKSGSWLGEALGGNTSREVIMQQVNDLNKLNNYKEGKTPTEAIQNFLQKIPSEAKRAENALKGVRGAVGAIPKDVRINVTLSDFVGVAQTAMSNVQGMMADGALSAFDASWDAKEAGAGSGADARKDALEEAKQKALDAIQAQIDAEKKADEIRQRLFENEKARLEKLAELQNQQIDFDRAVMEGKLDEAAKIQNNMQVTSAKDQMDKDNQAAQIASDKRIEQLEKREKAIERMYEKRIKAAEKAAANEQANIARTREMERASLEQRLNLFKAYTARNQGDLERWMKQLGFKYEDFGVNLTEQSGSWASTFQTTLSKELRIAGQQVASDAMWERMAKAGSMKLLKGLGFRTVDDFMSFVGGNPPKYYTGAPVRHTGGEVSSAPGSRGPISKSYQGLHRSERMILAQDGEYVVNKASARKYGDILKLINRGVYGGRGDMTADLIPGRSFAPIYGTIVGAGAMNYQRGVAANMQRGIEAMTKKQRGGLGGVMDAIGSAMLGVILGPGGKHRPIAAGTSGRIHGSPPAVDFAAPVGTPVRAVADGRITGSYDIRGYEPRRAGYGKAQDGFKSYGRVVEFKTNAGPSVLYAHLSKRAPASNKMIPGGSIIGRSGDTGNSTGPHLHFGSSGVSPMAWLRNGGEVKFDNTPALLHAGESVMTRSLTSKFKDNVASGDSDGYNVTVDLRGAYIKEDVDIEKAVNTAIDKRESKRGRSRVVS